MLGQVGYAGANGVEACGIGGVLERVGDPGGDGTHFAFTHAAGGESGRANADAGGLHGGIGVVGDGVLVDGDASLAEGMFSVGAEEAAGEDVDEDDVGVGSTGDDAEAVGGEFFGEDFGVGDDLRGVGAEVGLEGFAEGDGLGGDDVHEGAALLAGEDGAVDARGELLFAED